MEYSYNNKMAATGYKAKETLHEANISSFHVKLS
jgi:hypothetical protein